MTMWKTILREDRQTPLNKNTWIPRNITNGELQKSKIVEHSWKEKPPISMGQSVMSKEENSSIRKLK